MGAVRGAPYHRTVATSEAGQSPRVTVSPATYRRIVRATIVLFALITVTGVGVRVTGSGLGCEQWPRCNDDRFVAELSDGHALVEFANRLLSGVVLLPVIGCVVGARRRRPRRADLIRWSSGLLAVLALEIPLGGLTVLLGLEPPVVMAHFLVSMALVAMAVILEDRAGRGPDAPQLVVPGQVHRWAKAATALGAVVIVSGTLVTGAGPHGGDPGASRLPLSIADVARLHSLAMWIFLVATVITLWLAYRAGAPERVRKRAVLLTGLILLQGGVGYAQYALAVPAGLVVVHVTMAVIVWMAALRLQLALHVRPPEEVPRSSGELGSDSTAPGGELGPTPARSTVASPERAVGIR